MQYRSAFALTAITAVLAACAGSEVAAPVSPNDALLARGSGSTVSAQGFAIRVTCELRTGRRSKISVDGNNLTPLNGMWSAKVTSGGQTVAAPQARGVGDEVEFDFDSDPADIAAGATAIARGFIVPNATGPDVTAQILDASGAVVVSGGAECRVR